MGGGVAMPDGPYAQPPWVHMSYLDTEDQLQECSGILRPTEQLPSELAIETDSVVVQIDETHAVCVIKERVCSIAPTDQADPPLWAMATVLFGEVDEGDVASDLALANMTAEQVVDQFRDVLSDQECAEIIEFDLDGSDTLAMIFAMLNDRDVPLKKIDELMARFEPVDATTQPH